MKLDVNENITEYNKKIIHTERMILRHFKKNDLEDLYEYCSQNGVGEMAGWPKHTSIEYTKKVLEYYMKNENLFAIVYKKNNKVIGHIGVNEDCEGRRKDIKELGYALNRKYWNKGIMTEVLKEFIRVVFERWQEINYVYACCFKHNFASKRLIERCGFRFNKEGVFESILLNKSFNCYEYYYSRKMWDSKYLLFK